MLSEDWMRFLSQLGKSIYFHPAVDISRARCFEKEKKKKETQLSPFKETIKYVFKSAFSKVILLFCGFTSQQKEAYLSNFVQPSTQLNWNGKDYDKVYFSPPLPYDLWINGEVQSSENVARKAGTSPGQVRVLEAEGVKKKNVKSIMDNDAAASWSIDSALLSLHFMFKDRWAEVKGQKRSAWYTFRALCH